MCIGITGAISASALPAYIMLIKASFKNTPINVVQTKNSEYFLSHGALKHLPNVHLYTSLDDLKQEDKSHMGIIEDIDFFIVCPATANFLGKAANGIADDLLSLCFLAANCKKIIMPAMNSNMYRSKVVQRNINQLISDGNYILGPKSGLSVQDAAIGDGGLEEPLKLIKLIKQLFDTELA